jgi:CRISPR-associated exonuclease Cas4
LHKRVHKSSRTKRGKLIQLRRVYVYSKRWGISGFADVLEGKGSKVYPVEYKRGKSGGWQNDKIQLCAQAICLEEMLNVEIVQAYIFYVSSGRRREIKLDEKLRKDTIKTIGEVRKLFKSKNIPPPLNDNRCRGCSLKPKCLPKETIKIKRAKLHWK